MAPVPYQDQIGEDGSVEATGYRSCEDRYAVIRTVAEKLRRPFTVLDLGAASGYFAIRLTEDFGARAVAVDSSRDILAAEGRVAAVVNRVVSPEDVRRLGTFDLVLGLSFLHHQRGWRGMLGMMKKITRSALVVETPNPREKLRQAVGRNQLGAIQANLSDMKRIGESPAVWDHSLKRGIFVMRRPGIAVDGRIFGGSGNNGLHTARFAEDLTDLLGYTPVPGSLNVRTSRIFRLGAYAGEYVDERRGRGGRRGGDYQIWCARVEGYDGPVHVMRPGARGHGRDVLEVWAPVRLKDHLGVENGDRIRLRIGA